MALIDRIIAVKERGSNRERTEVQDGGHLEKNKELSYDDKEKDSFMIGGGRYAYF